MSPESLFENTIASLVLGQQPLAKIMAISEHSALLYLKDRSYAVIYRYLPGSDEQMGDHMLKVASSVKSGVLYMVLVGGSERQKELLATTQVGWGMGRMVRVVHIGDDGKIWFGKRMTDGHPLVRAIENRPKGRTEGLYEQFNELVDPNADGSQEMAAFIQQLKQVKPMVTWALVGICVFIFGLASLWGGAEYVPSMIRMGANLPMLTRAGQFERLASSVFLHAGLTHLGMNMLGLWVLGAFLERILGSWRILLLFCVSGLAGSASSAWLGSAQLSVGASGAIWGLLASSAVLAFVPSAPIPSPMVDRLKRSAMMILAINLMISFLPRIDIWAHMGGGVAGAAITILPGFLPRADHGKIGKMPNPVWLVIVSMFFGVLLLGGAATALLEGKAWQLVQEPSYQVVSMEKGRLSLEIPTLIAQRRQDRRDHDSMESAFGDLGTDPLMVDVSIKLGYEKSDSANPHLEQLKSARQAQKVEGAKRQGTVTIKDMGSVPTVVELFVYPSKVRHWRYSQLRAGMIVTVTIINWPTGPSQWNQCNERIVASIETKDNI